jgi:hypothetical protein
MTRKQARIKIQTDPLPFVLSESDHEAEKAATQERVAKYRAGAAPRRPRSGSEGRRDTFSPIDVPRQPTDPLDAPRGILIAAILGAAIWIVVIILLTGGV